MSTRYIVTGMPTVWLAITAQHIQSLLTNKEVGQATLEAARQDNIRQGGHFTIVRFDLDADGVWKGIIVE